MPDVKPQGQPKKVVVYVALAPFELDGQKYAAGDEVVLPGWARDLKYDEARRENLFGKEFSGITFQREGPEIDKTTKERNLYRVTIPVKE
jgi:hypothetical protein